MIGATRILGGEVVRRLLEAIRAQHAGATDPLEKSFAALMRVVASGEWVFDSAPAREVLGMEMTPVRALACHVYATSA